MKNTEKGALIIGCGAGLFVTGPILTHFIEKSYIGIGSLIFFFGIIVITAGVYLALKKQ